MKKTLFILAVAALTFASCNNQNNQDSQEVKQSNNQTMELKKVEERTNMGAKLYVTPQPALMIATYDADGTPDVMMAAWGGQYDNNQVCFSLSKHKTTDNLRLNKAFTLSYADARTVVESDYFGIVSGYSLMIGALTFWLLVTVKPALATLSFTSLPLTMPK